MRLIFVLCLFLLLPACGGSGPGAVAADACMAEVNQRLTGKTFELDKSKLAASAEQENGSTDIWHLTTLVIFDRGLSTEFSQNLNCRTRVVSGAANVLSLEFIWAMKDLNLDKSAGS